MFHFLTLNGSHENPGGLRIFTVHCFRDHSSIRVLEWQSNFQPAENKSENLFVRFWFSKDSAVLHVLLEVNIIYPLGND